MNASIGHMFHLTTPSTTIVIANVPFIISNKHLQGVEGGEREEEVAEELKVSLERILDFVFFVTLVWF